MILSIFWIYPYDHYVVLPCFRYHYVWRRIIMIVMMCTQFIGVSPVFVYAQQPSCPDVDLVFARGTAEPPGIGRVGQALVQALHDRHSATIETYGVEYPAGRLQLGGGDGARDTIAHVEERVIACPYTRIVLGGYSQGASVMDIVTGTRLGGIEWGQPLTQPYSNHVVAVVTFGNVLGRSGQTISSLRPDYRQKALDLCHPGDPICHKGPGNDWQDHVDGYIPDLTNLAADFIMSKLDH